MPKHASPAGRCSVVSPTQPDPSTRHICWHTCTVMWLPGRAYSKTDAMQWDFCIRKDDRLTFRREVRFSLPCVQGFMARQALRVPSCLGCTWRPGHSDLLYLCPSITPHKPALKAIFKNVVLRPLYVPWLHHSSIHHW